jgi:hypothetical protein
MSDSKKKVADDDGMPETHNSHKSAAPVKVTKGAVGSATKFVNGKRVSAGASKGAVKRTGSIVSKVVAMLKQKKYSDEEIMKEAGAAKGTVMTQRFHLRAAGEKIPRYIRVDGKLVEKIRGQGGKSKANKGANAKATLTKAMSGLPAGKGKK